MSSLWDEDEFDEKKTNIFASFHARNRQRVRDAFWKVLNLSSSDLLEAWISFHLIVNYAMMHRCENGASSWMMLTKYCLPFAGCIMLIHFYSLAKYSPSGAIYMRVAITGVLFPKIDILPNLLWQFIMQAYVARGNRRLFDAVSNFICSEPAKGSKSSALHKSTISMHKYYTEYYGSSLRSNRNGHDVFGEDDCYSKQTKIICGHYYLSTLYAETKEMYRNHYWHLYSHRNVDCNYYQNNFIERIAPKIRKEMEENLTDRAPFGLDSICISNWIFLWHFVLGFDKFWIENFYAKTSWYYAIRVVYITMLIFGILQYLCKLYCFLGVLGDFESNSFEKDCKIAFILLGEFGSFGYSLFYVLKKDENRFIVRLYHQRFVERVLDSMQMDSDDVDRKTLGDIRVLCRHYEQRKIVFSTLEDVFGYDVGLLIMEYSVPRVPRLRIKFSRLTERNFIKSNVEDFKVFEPKKIECKPVVSHRHSDMMFDVDEDAC